MKHIGISITISQETDDMSHILFRIFNICDFDDKQYPKEYKDFVQKIIKKAIELAKKGEIE